MFNEIPMVRKRHLSSLKIQGIITNVTGLLRTPYEKQIKVSTSLPGLPGELPKSSYCTTDNCWNNYNDDLLLRIREVKNSKIELRKL